MPYGEPANQLVGYFSQSALGKPSQLGAVHLTRLGPDLCYMYETGALTFCSLRMVSLLPSVGTQVRLSCIRLVSS